MRSTTRTGFASFAAIAVMVSVITCLFGACGTAFADTNVKTQAVGQVTAGGVATVNTQAATVFTVGNLKYSVITAPVNGKGTVKVVGVASKKPTKLTVPSVVTINGAQYQVVEIGKKAFKSWKNLKTAVISGTVKTIRADTFYNTSSLTKLVLNRLPKSTKFDKSALRNAGKGKGKNLNVCIPWDNLKQAQALLKAGLNKQGKMDGYPLSGVTVKFNANKGSVSKKSKKVTNFKKYGALPTPKRSRYVFLGWYTKKSGGEEVTKNELVELEKGITLYAHWYGPKGVGRTVTRAEYDRVKIGMSFSEVKFFVGAGEHSAYSYTNQKLVEDSHEEWVDTSYDTWVDDYGYDYDGYYGIIGGHTETVSDGYYQTVDDSYFVDVLCEGYYWYSSSGGVAYFDFEDGELVNKSRYGF